MGRRTESECEEAWLLRFILRYRVSIASAASPLSVSQWAQLISDLRAPTLSAAFLLEADPVRDGAETAALQKTYA